MGPGKSALVWRYQQYGEQSNASAFDREQGNTENWEGGITSGALAGKALAGIQRRATKASRSVQGADGSIAELNHTLQGKGGQIHGFASDSG